MIWLEYFSIVSASVRVYTHTGKQQQQQHNHVTGQDGNCPDIWTGYVMSSAENLHVAATLHNSCKL